MTDTDRLFTPNRVFGYGTRILDRMTMDVDHSWWGWVGVSHGMMPRIVQPDPTEPLFCAVGHGGNKVSYSAQAGRRLAELVAGRTARHVVPIFKGELPDHAVAPFRRLGQRMLCQTYHRRDKRPN